MKQKVLIVIAIILVISVFQMSKIKKENEKIRKENKIQIELEKKEEARRIEEEELKIQQQKEEQEEKEIVKNVFDDDIKILLNEKYEIMNLNNMKEVEIEIVKEIKKEIEEPIEKIEVVEKEKPVNEENEVVLNQEKIDEAQDNATISDRAKAVALMVKRLSASEIVELKNMASDGFTNEEKILALEMLQKNFTADEQKYIWELYAKYAKGE